MNAKGLNDFDKYFIQWWEENKKYFESQIRNQELCDEAVKHIAVLDHFLKGFKWEMNETVSVLLHSYFKKTNRIE